MTEVAVFTRSDEPVRPTAASSCAKYPVTILLKAARTTK